MHCLYKQAASLATSKTENLALWPVQSDQTLTRKNIPEEREIQAASIGPKQQLAYVNVSETDKVANCTNECVTFLSLTNSDECCSFPVFRHTIQLSSSGLMSLKRQTFKI
jgi:hypothetical protein